MYVSDTEDDPSTSDPRTRDHILEVSPEALAKVYFRLVFKLMLTSQMSSFDDIGKE